MRPVFKSLSLATVVVGLTVACSNDDKQENEATAFSFKTLSGKPTLITGHRGASGLRPEHTLASYALAMEQGADFVEPDLVLTKDGVLIARHEPMLGGTTDVATKFPDRKTAKMLDGVNTEDYFASDFTLAEIKTLRAKQSRAGRSAEYDGLYEIPTLDEVITLVKTKNAETGRNVGIYPEIKHSTFHATEAGFSEHEIEDKLLHTLHLAYGNTHSAPVFIQSFEVSNLQYLNTKTDIALVQLVDADDVDDAGNMVMNAPYAQPYDFVVSGDSRQFKDLVSSEGLDFVKSYADVIAPWKPYLLKTVNDGIERTGDSTLTVNDRRVDGSTGVIEMAHQKGLMVHTWTFRDDAGIYGFTDAKSEMQAFMKLGLDGLFTDFPATGVAAVTELK